MKAMNIAKKYGAKAAIVVSAPLALATQAWAAVPEAVTTELATAKTDAISVGGVVLGIIVAIFGLMIIRKVLR
ncbi:major capsid protein [Neisseria sp. Dent CA1/247]|uniref:major capsid protein n=1 Tax=Neisseria sp. Dent CA1/247 TaxID=2912675 RepID=UPI001FD1007D|nr:major capsid protein [Neisseria sp. Dent CA1/247]UOO76753.1 major capsid protein [Neisseria sp. Dent CA1/247]UOO77634.1 major capsid protein [Neisseria sp. Dent CA1/247]UOO78001.1 major capsid protein [Neisseria sp. Dent CA1/247]